ncbi:hypothetical protein CPS_3184 [Colwellia psychrerythraea 34H]|uniref:Uncharacterized protein n=1 Tax=Colwellia psychrerythraea (strain 34H / ATCC BAA-681) TaxID=167879 RepID=Q47Z90_COLP3|nr:hypothetical protein CPS_3184 [Colwellia psychrerythraea 34H]
MIKVGIILHFCGHIPCVCKIRQVPWGAILALSYIDFILEILSIF